MVSPCLAVLTEEGHVHEISLSMATAERCPSVSLSPIRRLAVPPPSSFSLSDQHMFISHECRCQAPDKLADAAASLLAKLATNTGKSSRARTVASSYSRSSPLSAPRAEMARMAFRRKLGSRHVPTACRVRAKATCKESPRTALSFSYRSFVGCSRDLRPRGSSAKGRCCMVYIGCVLRASSFVSCVVQHRPLRNAPSACCRSPSHRVRPSRRIPPPAQGVPIRVTDCIRPSRTDIVNSGAAIVDGLQGKGGRIPSPRRSMMVSW